jgi:15-cis-phytoene synthase
LGLERDYEYCRQIIKDNSKTFYKAFSKLPEDKRKAVYAVYAYCRISDDIIDEESDLEKLMEYKRELEQFESGDTPDTPVWRALRDVFNKYDMEIKPFYDMIEGQYKDAHFENIKTDEELYEYCYYVAGTVGIMILPIIAQKNHKKLKDTALDLGRAMQITNILRDVGEDYRKGRIYISAETMEKFEYSEEDLAKGIIDSRFVSVWESYAKTAEQLYKNIKSNYRLFDKDSLAPVILSAEYYKAILNEVRKNDYDCINKRAYVSDLKKLRIAIKVRRRLFF